MRESVNASGHFPEVVQFLFSLEGDYGIVRIDRLKPRFVLRRAVRVLLLSVAIRLHGDVAGRFISSSVRSSGGS